MGKVVIVTGGSRGIGRAAAAAFAEKGCTVYEISRRETDNTGVVHLQGDVTDPQSVETAVQTVIEREGRVDVLVCNAGTVLSGAIEFTEPDEIHKLFELNVIGAVNASRAVIPQMRKQGDGRIVCLSSVAAVFPIPFQAYYSASKAAVSALTNALHNELKPFGISVCAVLPGDTKTDPVRCKVQVGDDIYGGRINRSVCTMERDESNGMPPEKVGARIAAIALRKRVRPYYAVGAASKLQIFLSRLLPASAVRRVVGMIYAK